MSMTHQIGEKDSSQQSSTLQSPELKPASAQRRLPPAAAGMPSSNGISRWVFGGVPSFSNTGLSTTETRVERYNLAATIRIPDAEHDSGESDEPSPESSQVGSVAPPSPQTSATDLADGETVDLPIIDIGDPAELEFDSISATLGYSPSVTVSPDEPKDKTDFGSTWGNHVRTAAGGKIHRNGSTFEVTQTYENPIVIRVFKDAGPRSQVNIESETDSDITASNYPTVASNLTPGTDNRPPRSMFWARDLTLVHEQFHATDGQKFCKDAVDAAQKDLNTKTATTMDEVKALMDPIVQQIINARATGMTKPASEDRAYADGAKLYKARADKITAQGKAGKYP